MYYLRFLIKCFQTKFQFFFDSPHKKAECLAQNKLFFLAGIYYYDLKDYTAAISCFEKCHASWPLMKSYEKQGLYSKALEVAEAHGYYEEGAKMCLHNQNNKKAAYFYTFKKPYQAAKLYEKDGFYFEAGKTYLSAKKPFKALHCFKSCNNCQKEQGLTLLNDYGLVLFFKKQYEEAFKLFLGLDDYYSALECAKKMKEGELVDTMTFLVAAYEAEQGHFAIAAQYVEYLSPQKALFYYARGHSYYDMIRLLVGEAEYDKAINLCILHEQPDLAFQIAATYDPTLLCT